jgi:thiosulfate reductase cytochrome b subunit
VINPLIWITGWFYLFYNDWAAWGVDFLNLQYVAFFHVVAAFMMLIFVIAHIYLGTAGHTPTAHIKAMITGWEETDD